MTASNRMAAWCALLLATTVSWPHAASAETQARAQVLTRQIRGEERIIFNWDGHESVPFSIENRGNKVVLHFEKPVALRWGSTLEAMHSRVSHVQTHDGDSVTFTLKHPSEAHYLPPVDLHDTGNSKSGIEIVRAPDELPTETMRSPEENEAPYIPHQPWHAHAAVTPLHKAAVKRAHHHKPAAREAAAMNELAPAAGNPAAPVTIPAPAPEPGPAPAAAAPAPVTPAPVTVETPAPVPASPPAAVPAPAIALPASPSAQTTVSALPTTAPVLLQLPFKDDEPLAVFKNQKRLWIVSESATPASADMLRSQGAPLVEDAQAVKSSDPHASVLSLSLKEDVSASIEKVAPDGIRISLKPGEPKLAQKFLPTLVTGANNQSSLSIPAGKAAALVTFTDPVTGAALHAVPVTETAAGVPAMPAFVGFRVLPSSQGVAVETSSDTLTVGLEKGMISISAPTGLALSAEEVQHLHELDSEASLARLPPTLFPYARWKLDDEKNFVQAQEKFIHDITFNTPQAANEARLKLLGLYLSEGMFPEATGMADDILRSSLKFYQEQKVSALRGAAYLFMYRIIEAQRDFSVAELKDDPEAQIWRILCAELLGDSKQAFDFNGNYDRYISHYPPPFIQKLAIIAADRSINRKDYDAANHIFDTLKRDNFDEPVKKYIDYMHAKILSETHSEAEAAQIWEDQTKDTNDLLIRARAEFSLINMLLRQNKISHEEAIKRLDRLRIVWRGDSLELGVLTLLGNLYLQEKQYDNALHTMRDIVLYYPQVPEAVTTAQQMEDTFVMLYNKEGANNLPPLVALSLFYEFRDLVPLGKEGDQMIRNLAQRLVSIDLLDRAALLLDHQIKNRLQGEERSKVGAQLANIYLLNHQPDKALETLKTTGYGDLASDLQLERVRLTARALAQQGKEDKAIEVLSTDTSSEGTRLRLSIYWDNRDWANVIATAEDMLGNRTDPSAPLNVPESDVLLKLATAYVFEHDTGQLQYLHDYFTPLMKNNPNRDSFLFITSESGTVDYSNLGNLDQDIHAVKSFLAKSEDKPGKNGMSKGL